MFTVVNINTDKKEAKKILLAKKICSDNDTFYVDFNYGTLS